MVEPYIDAVSFIGCDPDLLKGIKKTELKQELDEKNQDLTEYIEEKINKLINPDNEKDKETSKPYRNNPDRIFNFIFTHLHNLFGKNNISNKGSESAEINDETALEIFNKFAEEDKTIISELYYGKKLVTKYCGKCKMTQYSYIYQRAIPLNLKGYKSDIYLENEINDLVIKSEEKEFCPFCSVERNLKITKTIKENPKTMIIVIKNNINNIRVNFDKYMFNKEYELIGVETTETPKNNKLCLFSKCLKPTQKTQVSHRFHSDSSLENNFDQIKKENPFVLYYKKIGKKKSKKKKTGKKVMNEENINSDEKFLGNNKNIIIPKKKKDKKEQQTNNIISDEDSINNKNIMTNINNINNINKNGKDITLYFNFSESKELYLDTNDNKTFKVILQEFEKKYKIKPKNIMFNEKKIDLKETPLNLGMKSEDHIVVMDDMII